MSYCRNDGACEVCDVTPDHCPDCLEPLESEFCNHCCEPEDQ